MIPKNITREHVIMAIKEIDKYGVPPGRSSRKYLLEFNGKFYPPKYVISLANKYANGYELDPHKFGGGRETNNYLRSLGFRIIERKYSREVSSYYKKKNRTSVKYTFKSKIPSVFPNVLLDRYVEVKYIGRGGFAKVFKVKRKDGKVVAVKIPISLDESTGRSFLRELANWIRLNHNNIVKIYDYNIYPIPYFEMELCDQSLADLEKPLDPERASWIIFNVAEGLKYAHSQRIIHRDLKPQNILLKDGIPKISDWGLSKVIAESTSATTTKAFTPHYASPEQVKGESKDERTDIWQLGVIFYELVTGELPFKGENIFEIGMAITTRDPIKPSEINPEAKEVENIIMKCLQKDKEKRYRSVIELQKDLAEYLGIKYKESLRLSITNKDFKRSAYYCSELLLINMKINNMVEAYKYAVDLLYYADGEIKQQVQELCSQLKFRIENEIKDIPEKLIKKTEVIIHKIKIEL